VVPGWTWHRHLPDVDAVLFSVNDTPIFKAFGLARREDKPPR
jgi:gentisate 1,2-dioxygenase